MDFTLDCYLKLLKAIKSSNYTFQTFEQFMNHPNTQVVILRNDVDKNPYNALRFATLQFELDIQSTYYFRKVKPSFEPDIIKSIAKLGHEIGYHYEDLSMAKGEYDRAKVYFENNLNKLRQFYPVKTICMHGSPLSKWDNRDLWKKYDYRKYGILGEPYFDVDYSKVMYFTDTGRRWNGQNVSVRDKVINPNQNKYKSTQDLINGFYRKEMSDAIMITMHPQRWHSNLGLWFIELVSQNLKNVIKALMVND